MVVFPASDMVRLVVYSVQNVGRIHDINEQSNFPVIQPFSSCCVALDLCHRVPRGLLHPRLYWDIHVSVLGLVLCKFRVDHLKLLWSTDPQRASRSY